MAKPRIITKSVAGAHAGDNETIIEFSNGGRRSREKLKGGLIAFRDCDDGTLTVQAYQTDAGVIVTGDNDVIGSLRALHDWMLEHTSPVHDAGTLALLERSRAALVKVGNITE